MRWPWNRHGSDDTDEKLEADRARLAEVDDQWAEVRAAAGRMTHHRRVNHFAESIATIYRSKP